MLTAEEVSELAKTLSPKEIAEKVDVVTTATFGAMCSSGAFLNFGHANPPIRMEKIELNGIRVSGGLAAVDTYVGATDCNPENPSYGGAHIIEDLIAGKEITLEAWGKGTDCYPRKHIKTVITKDTINEAILYNPRMPTRIITWLLTPRIKLNTRTWEPCCQNCGTPLTARPENYLPC